MRGPSPGSVSSAGCVSLGLGSQQLFGVQAFWVWVLRARSSILVFVGFGGD